MRLIDVDALMKRLKEDPLYPLIERYNIEGAIDAEPTIEERKTGRWIIEPGIGCKCSQCEFDIGNDLDWMEYVNYCPNCGAKMKPKQTLSEVDNDTAYGGLMSAT